ncbi:MAG TPA: serine/threonine-protein kinase [Myxococcaceae bacterium]|nr:serine/threonine-protein kinase [Myxococcaceae bacterium]
MSATIPPTVATPVALTEPLDQALPPGSMLKHFRVDRRLAAGGMGEVYAGFDTSLNRPVALKTIRPALARDRAFLVRFVREAQAQANVVHPHVVQIYFVGEDQGLWFMAMQLVDGGSLQDELGGGRPLDWQRVASHFVGLAEGMAEAARLNIIHRDIKPANILVDRYGIAHLADFGLATAAGEKDPSGTHVRGALAGTETVTHVGTVVGTLAYMAPEQLRGETLDQRADVYGLGATMYHLLTGQPPVQARTPAEALQLLGGGAAPVRSRAPATPRALARIVDRCLLPEAGARFQTHAELSRALRAAAPQPEVRPVFLVRLLAALLDLTPFAVLLRFTYGWAPWMAPCALFLSLALGHLLLGASPGQWLMRLRVRTSGDGDVSAGRAAARALLQYGAFFPLAFTLSALYTRGAALVNALGLVTIVWAAAVLLGALPALGRRATLVDRLTGTRVLVDVR